jgi:hypothetical protein
MGWSAAEPAEASSPGRCQGTAKSNPSDQQA